MAWPKELKDNKAGYTAIYMHVAPSRPKSESVNKWMHHWPAGYSYFSFHYLDSSLSVHRLVRWLARRSVRTAYKSHTPTFSSHFVAPQLNSNLCGFPVAATEAATDVFFFAYEVPNVWMSTIDSTSLNYKL